MIFGDKVTFEKDGEIFETAIKHVMTSLEQQGWTRVEYDKPETVKQSHGGRPRKKG